MYDISESGEYQVVCKGAIPYAGIGSNRIIGKLPYESNRLSVLVDRDTARKLWVVYVLELVGLDG